MNDNITNEDMEQFHEMMIALAEAGVIEMVDDDGELAVRVVTNPGPEEMVRIYERWKLGSPRRGNEVSVLDGKDQ